MTASNWLSGLKDARQRAEVDAADLASEVGVSLTHYYRYEAGTRRIQFDRACRIADYLKCSLDDLRRAPAALPDDPGADGSVVATEEALAGWETGA